MEKGFYWARVFEEGDPTIAEVANDGKIWIIGSGDPWLAEHVTFGSKIPQPTKRLEGPER